MSSEGKLEGKEGGRLMKRNSGASRFVALRVGLRSSPVTVVSC